MSKYRILNQTITKNSEIKHTHLNAISFKNIGTRTAYINGEILPSGSSMWAHGNIGEIDTTIYTISFNNEPLASPRSATIESEDLISKQEYVVYVRLKIMV
jgi:hypothetical protein